jgi:hypothetical protein
VERDGVVDLRPAGPGEDEHAVGRALRADRTPVRRVGVRQDRLARGHPGLELGQAGSPGQAGDAQLGEAAERERHVQPRRRDQRGDPTAAPVGHLRPLVEHGLHARQRQPLEEGQEVSCVVDPEEQQQLVLLQQPREEVPLDPARREHGLGVHVTRHGRPLASSPARQTSVPLGALRSP